MKTHSRVVRVRSGAALITALLFVAIFATVIGGIAILAVGHNTLATRESDYASSIQVANAGLNFELRYVSQNQFQPGFVIHGPGNHDSGSVAGVSGNSFQAWITADDGTDWSQAKLLASGGKFWVYASGTVNGVTRNVKAHAAAGSNAVFPPFAAYGVDNLTFNGNTAGAVGDAGSNGTLNTSTNSIGTACITGHAYLDGPQAVLQGTDTGNVIRASDPLIFPTVNEIVAALFPTGWNALTSIDNRPHIRAFQNAAAGNAWATALAANNTVGMKAALVTTVPVTTSGPNRFTAAQQLVHNDINRQAGNYVILTAANAPNPTDYFFTTISTSGSDSIIVDNAGISTGSAVPGLIRIWVYDPSAGNPSNDNINNTVIYTAVTPGALASPQQYFALFYNKPRTFTIGVPGGGGNTIEGGPFYGVTTVFPPTIGTATFMVNGNSSLAGGSLIADNITFTGNSITAFTGNVPNPSFPWLWFGFGDSWQELPISGGVTFPDGTSN